MMKENTKRKSSASHTIVYIVLILISVIFLAPIFIVFYNSFKSKLYITSEPFALPNSETFAGLENYTGGLEKTSFLSAFGRSVFITVISVAAIVLFTSMTAWYITRVKNRFTKFLYFAFVFSMIVPFQMVMFTMVKTANAMKLDNPLGITLIYLGFGAGLSVFMFSGFVKGIPREIEEAAMIDGCGPVRTFFQVVLPMLKPTMISVGVLEIMWVWNDFLLPYLVLDRTEYMTIPIVIQHLKGSYGQVDMGATMALILLSILPVIIFYLCCQKHIIKGVAAGAVKG
mgnify:CR=1 FL=1